MEEYIQSYATSFLKETDIFPGDFIKIYKNNVNEA